MNKATEKIKINADICHEYVASQMKQSLAFNKEEDLAVQKDKIKEKLLELMGINTIALNACKQNFVIESDEQMEGYRQIRIVFESEKNMFVPAYLLIPTTGKKKYPLAITLQGHAKGGMLNSIGAEVIGEEDYQPRGAFALQAVKNGYAALALELRGMWGELQPQKEERLWGGNCRFTAMSAMLLGRTVIGERCWDVSRAIDLLPNFPEIDTDNIIITGNSGGGTLSFYAACVDERITLSAPSCSFCTFEQSILNVFHCPCNYIPNMYKYFDMHDLATLIAPRKLVIIAGKEDTIFTLDGVKKGFETVKVIYEIAGVPNNCTLALTPKGHYWCEDIVWDNINKMLDM